MATNRNQQQRADDPLDEFKHWMEQEDYAKAHPKFSSFSAIRRDIVNRRLNGLEKSGAIRKVGRRFLIHRLKYTAYRFGELRQ